MTQLTITEEFILCALNYKKKVSSLYSTEYNVCIISGLLLELLAKNVIQFDEKKKIIVTNQSNVLTDYEKVLVEYISSKKPLNAKKLIEVISFSMSSKLIKSVVEGVLQSLIAKECVTVKSQHKLFGEKLTYTTNDHAVNIVIEKMRAELLEDGEISDEVIVLTSLLLESKLLPNYFSKHETKQLKDRIAEVKNSDERKFIKEVLDHVESAMMAIIVAASVSGTV